MSVGKTFSCRLYRSTFRQGTSERLLFLIFKDFFSGDEIIIISLRFLQQRIQIQAGMSVQGKRARSRVRPNSCRSAVYFGALGNFVLLIHICIGRCIYTLCRKARGDVSERRISCFDPVLRCASGSCYVFLHRLRLLAV